MSKVIRNIIITVVIVVLIAAFGVFYFLQGRVIFNDGTVIGNDAGNLYNNGLFCERNGVVYFANAYDGYALYTMTPDETGIRKLKSSVSSLLNADGNYLYCYQSGSADSSGLGSVSNVRGIYRLTLDGKTFTCLDRTDVTMLLQYGNYLYYEDYNNKDFSTLKSCKIDGSEENTVSSYPLTVASVDNGHLYLVDTQTDHFLYTLDPASGTLTTVVERNMWNPIVQNGYVYFIDLESNYHLCRYSFATDTVEILTHDRVDFYNVYGSMIYYQTAGQTPELKRMNTDGSAPETVRAGAFENINVTSRYVYFNEFNAATPVYRTPTFGPISVSTFDAAKEAAISSK